MTISNAHLSDTCQVWDGLSYQMMDVREARKLQKLGTHQITTDLQAADLKSAAEFDEVREMLAGLDEATSPVKAKATPPRRAPTKKKTYNTRQMKAE